MENFTLIFNIFGNVLIIGWAVLKVVKVIAPMTPNWDVDDKAAVGLEKILRILGKLNPTVATEVEHEIVEQMKVVKPQTKTLKERFWNAI